MTSLFFGALSQQGVPADEKVVRSTADVYDADTPPAVQDAAPDKNELFTDPNPRLGLTGRQLASHWVQGVKGLAWWKDAVDGVTASQAKINEQVSSSGTAAEREARGEWGHGTMSYAIGIEPQGDLVDGGRMGNEYFKRHDRIVQETSDNTMMSIPPGYDQSTSGRVAAEGKIASRAAATAALYDAFWNEGK